MDIIIKVKKWPPIFRLCHWCNQRRVKDHMANTRYCMQCDELITRDQMGPMHRPESEPDSETNLLFEHEWDKVNRDR